MFLIENGIASLPIDLYSIAERNNWILLRYGEHEDLVQRIAPEEFLKCDGFSRIIHGRVFIAINDELPHHRKRFTLAHEFGHIALSHAYIDLNNKQYENEANMFAARILMPFCILQECDILTKYEVSKICDTSVKSADYRLRNLRMMFDKDRLYSSPLKDAVVEQFREFIVKLKGR